MHSTSSQGVLLVQRWLNKAFPTGLCKTMAVTDLDFLFKPSNLSTVLRGYGKGLSLQGACVIHKVFTVITLVISAGTRATALILQGSCISHGSQLPQFSMEKTTRCEQQWQQNSLWGSTFWLPVAVL